MSWRADTLTLTFRGACAREAFHRAVTDEVGGADDDRLQHLVQRTSRRDRALDRRQPLDQVLAIAQDDEQGLPVTGLALDGHPLLSFAQQGSVRGWRGS